MCRKNRAAACCMAAAGAGMLLALLLGCGVSILLGLTLIALGVLLTGKR